MSPQQLPTYREQVELFHLGVRGIAVDALVTTFN